MEGAENRMLAKGLLRQLQECQTKLQQETAACQELRQRAVHDENKLIARERETLAKEQEVVSLSLSFPFLVFVSLVSSCHFLSSYIFFTSPPPPPPNSLAPPSLDTRRRLQKHARPLAHVTRACVCARSRIGVREGGGCETEGAAIL